MTAAVADGDLMSIRVQTHSSAVRSGPHQLFPAEAEEEELWRRWSCSLDHLRSDCSHMTGSLCAEGPSRTWTGSTDASPAAGTRRPTCSSPDALRMKRRKGNSWVQSQPYLEEQTVQLQEIKLRYVLLCNSDHQSLAYCSFDEAEAERLSRDDPFFIPLEINSVTFTLV